MAAASCGGGDDNGGAPVDGAATAQDAPMMDALRAEDGGGPDARPGTSDAAPLLDGSTSDAAVSDASAADASSPDASLPDASPADAGHTTEHVHIYIDNFCNVSTSPTSITVPPGGSVNIAWHNHSIDYEADVWMSYGGGYLELARGGTWNETFNWCAGVAVFTGTADIGPAGVSNSVCPHVYFPIRCL
jgi:hypothetical protein